MNYFNKKGRFDKNKKDSLKIAWLEHVEKRIIKTKYSERHCKHDNQSGQNIKKVKTRVKK